MSRRAAFWLVLALIALLMIPIVSTIAFSLLDDDGVFGLIDLDSPTPGRFDKDDQAGIEALAAIYVAASSFED